MADQYSLEDSDGSVRLRHIWDEVVRRLSREVTTGVHDKFVKPLKPVMLSDGKAVISAPGAFVAEWVREKLIGKVERVLGDELGQIVQVEILTKERDRSDFDQPIAVTTMPRAVDSIRFVPNTKYTFDGFIVGQSNRLAVAGARAVAQDPGKSYNPLFIYGQSGLGKTHLLHAIAQEILRGDPTTTIAYITGQQFAEDFVQSLQTSRVEHFRRAQRNATVWLVDDIQFIAGKEKTQEELFHTFNYLQQIGKQIVLCADRTPRQLFLMDDRLRSRFEAGLVADIQPPDTETRCAILMSKAAQDRIDLPHNVAMYLAESISGNVRILEGALVKIQASASLDGVPITLDLAESIISNYYRNGMLTKPGIDQIVDAVSHYYKIPNKEIKGISRKAPIAHARHVAVYITREITGDSWKHIGSLFGDRDHTSMMHAHQKISEMVTRDRELSAIVKSIIRNLKPEM